MQALAHHREQGRNYDVESFLRGASAAAGRMLAALAWYYPELEGANERRWDFLVTAAGLYLVSRDTELTSLDRSELPAHLAQGMASCHRFVGRASPGITDSRTFDWAIGYWLLSGLFREEPGVDRVWLAAAIGEALGKTSNTLASLTRLRPAPGSTTRASAAVATAGKG